MHKFPALLFLLLCWPTRCHFLGTVGAFVSTSSTLKSGSRYETSSYRFRTMMPTSASSESSSSSSSSVSAREVINWIKAEQLESLLPKADTLQIIAELLSDAALIDDSEALVIENSEKIERKLQSETRSISSIIGSDATDRILASVENIDGYDPDAVRAFLGSEAVNKLLAQILYDGIYNFFQTIDVFGNIIGQLPIIGPLRNKIRDDAKRNLDRTVGPLIQTFLRSYTKTAVLEAAEFVLSPSNRKVFAGANVKLVKNVLDRPLNTLIPPSDMTASLRNDLFDYVRRVKVEDVEEYVTFCYDIVGDKAVDDVFNVNRVIDASPTLGKTIDRIWSRATVHNE